MRTLKVYPGSAAIRAVRGKGRSMRAATTPAPGRSRVAVSGCTLRAFRGVIPMLLPCPHPGVALSRRGTHLGVCPPPTASFIGQTSFNLHPSGGLKASPKLPSGPTRRARRLSRRSTARDGTLQLPRATSPHRRVLSHRLAPLSTNRKLQNHTDQRLGSAGGSLRRRPEARSGPSSPRGL